MAVSGVVLAGGFSSRMGRDKMLLTIENEPLLMRTVKELRSVADEIIVASNHTSRYNLDGVREVADIFPEVGPMGGLHAGLLASKYDAAFVTAGDMPYFTGRLAEYLVSRQAGHDVVVPRIGGQWEPLCAVYSRACIGPIEYCLRAGIRKVFRFYPLVRVLAVDENELAAVGLPADIFFNLNTPADLLSVGVRKDRPAEGDWPPPNPGCRQGHSSTTCGR